MPGKLTHVKWASWRPIRIVSIRPAPAGDYEPVTTRPDDTRFDPVAPPDVEVKRVMTGHVLVRPKVDGRDIGWFIFDTGAAGTMIDPTASAKLKLERLGSVGVTSVLGNEQSSILRANSLALGPMTVAKPFLVTMDLGYVRTGLGEDVVGIVGYDILARCVAEITLADDSIKLYDPKAYRHEPAPWQPLAFNQSVPLASATFQKATRKGLFRIDVGASGPGVGNVVFHAYGARPPSPQGRKVTPGKIGPTRIARGKIAWFELAGHRFANPDVVFAIDRRGPFGDEYVDGNIGVEFLKPFRMNSWISRTRASPSSREARGGSVGVCSRIVCDDCSH